MLSRGVLTASRAGRAPGVGAARARGIVYANISQTVGRTPVVRINRLAPPGVEVYAKLEYFNPLSSVKDRLGLAIIEHAERKGLLKPGDTVVEATSGNTGISLAMMCAQRGYRCVICMAESFSVERRKIMRALGAKVVLTPASERGTGMVKKAQELSRQHGWYLARQFENEANREYHAMTTGPEILQDFAGRRLDYWVTGYGTGGTFAGAGMMIKAARPEVKIVLSEPVSAALVTSGIGQEREADGSPAATHPAFKPHPIQGWTPDFIPMNLSAGLDAKLHDEVITVTGEESIATSLSLAQHEGIFTGISGGAGMATALKVAASAPKGSAILVMLPDTAERYLSTPLFAKIEAEMDEGELEISRSTPGFQL
ncbi:cysteine synthase A [Pavlovales sp. CCMP2436]|nr:cysteine synthase A [Pavlovales sp. CCMP2436]